MPSKYKQPARIVVRKADSRSQVTGSLITAADVPALCVADVRYPNCSVFLASWCRKWTQCCLRSPPCVSWGADVDCVCICVDVCVFWVQVGKHERLRCRRVQGSSVQGVGPALGGVFSIQAQPVEPLPCVTHKFCHAAGVEDQRTHHFVQLQEKICKNKEILFTDHLNKKKAQTHTMKEISTQLQKLCSL